MRYIVQNEDELLRLAYSFIMHGVMIYYRDTGVLSEMSDDTDDESCSFIVKTDMETIEDAFRLVINVPASFEDPEYIDQHDDWELTNYNSYKVDTDEVSYKYPVIISTTYPETSGWDSVWFDIYSQESLTGILNDSGESNYDILIQKRNNKSKRFTNKARIVHDF